MHLSHLQMILFRRMESLRPGDGKRYSNAHNAEAAVALYERAEDDLRCCHDFALNNSELRSRLLQIALDHGMVP